MHGVVGLGLNILVLFKICVSPIWADLQFCVDLSG